MARRSSAWLTVLASAASLLSAGADARNGSQHDVRSSAPLIAAASPTLAPFQHVRFCLRYPSDCKSDATEIERIELSPETSALLERVNRGVNAEIAPVMKSQAPEHRGGWTIAPSLGDCNDYAVTKRHELLLGGLPAKALRLSVVKTRLRNWSPGPGRIDDQGRHRTRQSDRHDPFLASNGVSVAQNSVRDRCQVLA